MFSAVAESPWRKSWSTYCCTFEGGTHQLSDESSTARSSDSETEDQKRRSRMSECDSLGNPAFAVLFSGERRVLRNGSSSAPSLSSSGRAAMALSAPHWKRANA